MGLLIGNILFIIGVWIFRTLFLTKNWRWTMGWTTILFAVCYAVTHMTIYDVDGFGQDQRFFALGPSGSLSNCQPLLTCKFRGMFEILTTMVLALAYSLQLVSESDRCLKDVM